MCKDRSMEVHPDPPDMPHDLDGEALLKMAKEMQAELNEMRAFMLGWKARQSLKTQYRLNRNRRVLPPHMQKMWVTRTDALELLQVSEKTLKKYRRNEMIRARILQRYYRFYLPDILALLHLRQEDKENV